MRYFLSVQLLSDATFGRGEGLAGLVDIEVDHDDAGCPQIGGRTLKGLLVEEWANLRFALGDEGAQAWLPIADLLFGSSGAGDGGGGRLHVGAATLPADLRDALRAAQDPNLPPPKRITRAEVLAALTTIRRQTSVNAATGAPEAGSLRAARAVVRGVTLIAPLELRLPPADAAKMVRFGDDSLPLAKLQERAEALLAACALAVRRGGLSRNRGRGKIALRLHRETPTDAIDNTFTRACFDRFAAEVPA